MADLVMVATMVGFVLLCVAYVRWCESIVGPDPEGRPVVDEDPPAHDGHASEVAR